MAAADIHNLVRAVTHPYPGAFAELLGQKTMVWKTRMPASSGTKKGTRPGMILPRGGNLFVACGDGNAIEFLTVQRPDGPEMSGTEFVKRFVMAHREEKS